MRWVEEEFDEIEFGDKRLNARLKKVGEELFRKPVASINQACGGWRDTKAAYRLFDNEKVEASKILELHRRKTVVRMQAHKTVLAIQDTTFLNYNSHESKEGLGLIHSNKVPVKGLLVHNTLMVTPDGLPLGLFDQKIYARKNKSKRSSHTRKIEEKESYRWLEPVKMLAAIKELDQHCIIVGDREADIFELMHCCNESAVEFVFRSAYNRAVGTRKKRWIEGSDIYLFDYVAEQESKGEIEVKVTDRKTKKERTASLELRYCPVIFPAPWRMDYAVDGPSQRNKDRLTGSRSQVNAYVVEVREAVAPKGTDRIHWRLVTSLPVSSREEATQIIEYYKTRWSIEIYHRVLKSGCAVEDCRLETFARLEKCITLYSVIAWRLFWLTKVSRGSPDKPCREFFSKHEWQTIYRAANKTKNVPQEIPTIRQIIRWMAQLGGFLARKSDGEPGITTIWRGWQTLNIFLTAKTYG